MAQKSGAGKGRTTKGAAAQPTKKTLKKAALVIYENDLGERFVHHFRQDPPEFVYFKKYGMVAVFPRQGNPHHAVCFTPGPKSYRRVVMLAGEQQAGQQSLTGTDCTVCDCGSICDCPDCACTCDCTVDCQCNSCECYCNCACAACDCECNCDCACDCLFCDCYYP